MHWKPLVSISVFFTAVLTPQPSRADVAASAPAASQPVAAGCSSPESRQLDFWVGYWEVRPRGSDKIIAHSLIEKRYAGCAIRENWMPLGREATGGGGSLSSYDVRRKAWRQVWVDSTGERVDLEGGLKDGAITIAGLWHNFVAPGQDALVAMHYRLQASGEVRQWAESSTDNGKTWTPNFDFLYRRSSTH